MIDKKDHLGRILCYFRQYLCRTPLQVKNFRTHFTISGLATGLILGLAPSLWDSVSDFVFAHEEENRTSLGTLGPNTSEPFKNTSISSSFTYFFVSLPGLMSAAKGLHRLFSSLAIRLLGNSCQNQTCYWLVRAVKGLANYLFLATLLVAGYLCFLGFPPFFYYSAVLSTIMVLGIKTLALFVHGPEMKKLSTRATSAESQYESSLQILLVVRICLKTQNIPLSSASSILSSLLMIGKSGAESYLTFGEENKLEKRGEGWQGLINKLKLLATYSPVFLATALFRLSALSIVLAWNPGFGVLQVLLVGIVAPSLLFLLMKLCKVKDLSVVEILEGVLAELTTHSLWGGRGREGSKKINLFITIYHLAVHTVCLLFAVFNASSSRSIDTLPIMCPPSVRQPAALSCIFFGWLPRVVLSFQLQI